MRNVTISLDESLLQKSRAYAAAKGESFNELVRNLLVGTVEDGSESIAETFAFADRMGWKLTEPIPGREERNAR